MVLVVSKWVVSPKQATFHEVSWPSWRVWTRLRMKESGFFLGWEVTTVIPVVALATQWSSTLQVRGYDSANLCQLLSLCQSLLWMWLET